MGYAKLEDDELVVLAGALRLMMVADGAITQEEIDASSAIGTKLGLTNEQWDEIWDEAARELPTQDAVMEAAIAIERPAAREVIYEQLYEMAGSDAFDDSEWDILEVLDEEWMSQRDD